MPEFFEFFGECKLADDIKDKDDDMFFGSLDDFFLFIDEQKKRLDISF